MDEARAGQVESGGRLVPLPERRPPGAMRHWPSQQPVMMLVAPFLVPAAMLLVSSLGAGFPAALTLLIALSGTIWLTKGARRLDVALRARARDRHPQEPWVHDYAWDPRGETRSSFVRMVEAMSARTGWRRFVVFALLVAGLVFVGGGIRWLAAALVGSAATLVAIAGWRIHGAGDAHVAYAKFPFHPGEPVTLYFRMSEGGAEFRRIEFCIAHVAEASGGWFDWERRMRRSYTGFDCRPPGPLPGPDFDVEVAFDVPDFAPGTRIADRFPEYWVLEVRGVTTRGPFQETFLVPIYERPEPAAAPGTDEPAAPVDAQ